MTEINDTLTAKGRPNLVVVGSTDAGAWVVQTADFTTGPQELTDDQARAYGVHDAPKRGNVTDGWRNFGEAATSGRRSILPQRPVSPEDRLRDGTADPVSERQAGSRAFDGTEVPA